MTLADILAHLKADPRARLLLADAIAGAEAAADEDATWDEILTAAIDELLTTPAGRRAPSRG